VSVVCLNVGVGRLLKQRTRQGVGRRSTRPRRVPIREKAGMEPGMTRRRRSQLLWLFALAFAIRLLTTLLARTVDG
jgi:hypothetical protein